MILTFLSSLEWPFGSFFPLRLLPSSTRLWCSNGEFSSPMKSRTRDEAKFITYVHVRQHMTEFPLDERCETSRKSHRLQKRNIVASVGIIIHVFLTFKCRNRYLGENDGRSRRLKAPDEKTSNGHSFFTFRFTDRAEALSFDYSSLSSHPLQLHHHFTIVLCWTSISFPSLAWS